jgi:hypothetical protein
MTREWLQSPSGLYVPGAEAEPDPVHAHIRRRVTLWDAVTGAVVTVESTENLWWWTEGSGSCDCNRSDFFPEVEEPDDTGHCIGCKRFLVVKADPPLDWVVDANDGYPDELRQAAQQRAAGIRCQQCGAPLPTANELFSTCGPNPPQFRHSFTCGHEIAFTCRECFDADRHAACSVCGRQEEYTA